MTPAPRTDVSAIAPLSELGRGGQGKVFSTSRSLKDPPISLVYKEYLSSVGPTIDDAVLASMPALLESLPKAESLPLLSHAAWPCLIVEKSGRTSGFLMPAIPDHFRITMKLSSGPKKVIAEFQHLLNDESYLVRRGIQLSDRRRYELLHAAAEGLGMLHGLDISVGDLSPKNLLFSLSPKPDVFFIDCDAMCFKGKSVTDQFETPGWEVRTVNPGEELATTKSDSLKFGLLALRLLAGDQSTWDLSKLPKSVPSDVRALISAALNKRPGQRPSPSEWIAPLTAAIKKASKKMPSAASVAPNTITLPVTAIATPGWLRRSPANTTPSRAATAPVQTPAPSTAPKALTERVASAERFLLPTVLALSFILTIRPWDGYWSGTLHQWQWAVAIALFALALRAPWPAVVGWGAVVVLTMGSVSFPFATALVLLLAISALCVWRFPFANKERLASLLLLSVILETLGLGPLGLIPFVLLYPPLQAGLGAGLACVSNLIASLITPVHPFDIDPGGGRFFIATSTSGPLGEIPHWFKWIGHPAAFRHIGSSLNFFVADWILRPKHLLVLALWVATAVGASLLRQYATRRWCREAGVGAALVGVYVAWALSVTILGLVFHKPLNYSAGEFIPLFSLFLVLPVGLVAAIEYTSLKKRKRAIFWGT